VGISKPESANSEDGSKGGERQTTKGKRERREKNQKWGVLMNGGSV